MYFVYLACRGKAAPSASCDFWAGAVYSLHTAFVPDRVPVFDLGSAGVASGNARKGALLGPICAPANYGFAKGFEAGVECNNFHVGSIEFFGSTMMGLRRGEVV